MASSALSGDRRLAFGRRGGMTVLGKVAVPKPINLPSQRLENHGLDPNVEIVPKGTLSWGNRTSTVSNAWGSSTLSPRTDGGTLSPSNLSARPSSGESGTRPSTAGSDRAHEPSTTAWGSNSRPSSASGAHRSSQTSILSLRPRSAETRPGSSQLSRFAESSPENSVGGAVERFGMTSSRNDGFSLSSGDFPVLGSEKNGLGKSYVSQEHPSQGSGSPSSIATHSKEDNEVKNSVLNSWRREDAVFSEYGVRSGIDQWHRDSPSFPNSGMRPQHFNAWRGPIVNNHPPGSSLYRGPPGGPYGGPVAPSGFHMEPFPYYHHQAAPPVLPNPPSVPPSSTGPGGHRPNNGEFYRPLIRGAFVRPNMPVRPGFFPSPLPYDGYFGPQLRYHSPNKQDIAFAGMAPGVPSPYSRYPAPENDNLNAGPSEFDSKIASSEEAELGHLHVSGGQYKVLLKQHDSWDEKGESNQQGETKATSESPLNLGSQEKTDHPENDRKLEQMQGIEKNSDIGDPKDSQTSDDRVNNTSAPWRVPESVPGHADDVDLARRSEQKRSAPEVLQSPSATAKDSSLIQKIESLNAKNRASDARADTLSTSDWRDQDAISQRPLRPHSALEIKSEAQVVKKNQGTRNFKPEESGQIFAGVGKIHERTVVGGAIISRSYPHGGLGRAQHYGGRVSTLNADEWHKNPICMNPVAPSVETSNILPNIEVGDRSVSCTLKNEGESKSVTTDSSDSPAERARLKELAKQRTRRRQEEEEERARDQKARALVKLEELNKRRQLEESLNLKTESSLISGTVLKSEQQQGLHPPPGKAKDSTIVPSHGSISETLPVSQIDGRMSGVEGSMMLSGDTVPIRCQTSHLQQDVKSAGVIDHDPENMTYKHSRGVSKEKPNRVSGEPAKLNDRTTDVAKLGESLLNINPSTEKSQPSNPQNVVETIVHQRRKGSKTSRTKQRVDNLSPASASIMAVNEEASRASTPEENGMSESLKPDLESSFIQQLSDSKDLKQSMEHPLAPLTETAQVRFSSHGRRSLHPRRTLRNQQINNLSGKMHGSDAVMWAPRSQNKIEVAVETDDVKPAEEANPSLKNDVSQKNAKHKRTEMERYIPTPVAKQMAQQGCVSQAVPRNNKSSVVEETLQVVSSVSQSDENVQSQRPVQGKESRNLDGGQNRLGGAVVSWRQRNRKESVTEGESRFAGSGKDDRIMIGDLAKESGMRYSKEKQKLQDHASGDWPDTSFNSDPNSDVDQATRDQESVARVKHSNYGVTGTDMDIKQKRGGEFSGKRHNQSPVFDQHQRVPAAVSRESHGFVDRLTTQWQPKAQKVFGDDPQGSRPSGGKWVQIAGTRVDVEEPPKADAAPHDWSPQKPRSHASATGHNAKLSSRTDHASGGRPDFNVNRENRIVPQNRRPTKLQGSAPPAVDEVQQKELQMHLESFENRISHYAGGNNNSWEDWNQRGHYRKQQHHPPSNRERQHSNSHYRYQTVGTEDVDKTG